VKDKLIRFQLTVHLEEQPEGGYTITCPDLPELITECDSLDEAEANVIDAFRAIVGLYEHKRKPLPESIQVFETDAKATQHLEMAVSLDNQVLEMAVP
jgi:antitoxin HicB